MCRYKELKKENETLKTEVESMEATREEREVLQTYATLHHQYCLPGQV